MLGLNSLESVREGEKLQLCILRLSGSELAREGKQSHQDLELQV